MTPTPIAPPLMPQADRPSAWVRRWSHLVPVGASVLDLACGSGRHVRWFAARGCQVTGVDRDAQALQPLRSLAEVLVADLEAGAWPLPQRRFDAVVVTNYLWRDRLPDIVAGVTTGGVLLYETFAAGHETIGRPRRPDFLLRPGELLDAVRGLRVVAFEDGFEPADPVAGGAAARFVQRIVAVRESVGASAPAAYRLPGPAPGAGG